MILTASKSYVSFLLLLLHFYWFCYFCANSPLLWFLRNNGFRFILQFKVIIWKIKWPCVYAMERNRVFCCKDIIHCKRLAVLTCKTFSYSIYFHRYFFLNSNEMSAILANPLYVKQKVFKYFFPLVKKAGWIWWGGGSRMECNNSSHVVWYRFR